jgi:hypothetical protein
MTNEHSWHPFDDGKTLGTIGSENGIIVCDEEHADGARITLEQDGYTPFAVTCGIYGWMVHTAFASSIEEALELFAAMQAGLEEILQIIPDADDPEPEAKFKEVAEAIRAFVDKF